MCSKILLKIILFLNFAWGVAIPQAKLYPIDESSKDSSLLLFKENINKAAKDKNIEFIINSLDKNVLNSFGGDGGIAEFKQTWDITNPESTLWEELQTILSLGGTFIESEGKKIFAYPYVYSAWPEQFDLYEFVAVIDSSVSMRTEPDHHAPVIKSLSYDLIRPDYQWEDNEVWMSASTTDGSTGFIERNKTRSPLDYRMGLQNIKGIWKIVWIISGD